MWNHIHREDAAWLLRKLDECDLATMVQDLQNSLIETDGMSNTPVETENGFTVADAFGYVSQAWPTLASETKNLLGVMGDEVPYSNEDKRKVANNLASASNSLQHAAKIFLESLHFIPGACSEIHPQIDCPVAPWRENFDPSAIGNAPAFRNLFETLNAWLGSESLEVIEGVVSSLLIAAPSAAGGSKFQPFRRPDEAHSKRVEENRHMDEKYKGEEHGQHWRKRDADRTGMSTLYIKSEDDRSHYRAWLSDRNIIRADGKEITSDLSWGWVLSDDDHFYVFAEFEAIIYDSEGNSSGRTILDSIRTASQHIKKGGKVKFTNHSTPVAGGDVVAAGMVRFDNYGYCSLDNWSGHYKPEAGDMGRAAEALIARHGMDPNTPITLKGLGEESARKTAGEAALIATGERVAAVRDGEKYKFDPSDVSVPASVMASLGGDADAVNIRLRERSMKQIKAEVPLFVDEPAQTATTAASTTGQVQGSTYDEDSDDEDSSSSEQSGGRRDGNYE
ncbi:hypothetical protein ACIQWN_32430 [Streptomyces vinaceus]|uniref:hypothetical protein n=1 Tax=Streptomyces vinaceus TaxID=1960 RepID=UPI00380BF50A